MHVLFFYKRMGRQEVVIQQIMPALLTIYLPTAYEVILFTSSSIVEIFD